MASFYDVLTGAFTGNCAEGELPPEGQGYVAIDPTVGMHNPVWNGEAWEAGEAVADSQLTDWDGLNLAIMSNPEFNQAYATVMGSSPLVAAALPAALTQVSSGQTSMFQTAFLAMCQIANVSLEQRGIWADIGATFNAPVEFLDIVRGEGNG